MPSLADRIRSNQRVLTRGPGGQLVEETQESIQELSKKAGLAAPPLTATGAAALGATPDQIKMQGTPQQKGAALQIAAQAAPEQGLQDAMRRQQVRSQATAQEAGKIQKSQDMQNLGQLGDRVTDFINVQRQKLATTTAVAPAAAETIVGREGAELAPDQAAAVKPLLEKLAANPNDMQTMLEINQALGYDANRILSPDEIGSLYANANESLAKGGAATVANQLTAQDLIQGGLGMDANQLAAVLGVPADQVAGMTVNQIQDQITKAMNEEFQSTAELERQAQSSQLGAAERALAREGAREASMVGLRSTEADVAALEQQISQADQVQFAGQQMSIEQLLSDDNISQTITNYLNAAPGSPEREQLEKTEPQLIQFIQKNAAVLDDAAKALSGGAQKFQQLQQENRQVATMGGLLSNELAADLIPGFNQLSAQKIDPNSVPVLAATQGMGENQKRQYAQNIQGMANEFPDVAGELGSLTAEELRELQLDSPTGKWAGFREEKQRFEEIMRTPDDDVLNIVKHVYDVGGSSGGEGGSFEQDVRLNAANRAFGFKSSTNSNLDLIDADGDGRIDSAADIRSRIVKGQPSLRGTLAGQKAVQEPQPWGQGPFDPPAYDRKLASDAIRFGKGSQREEQTQASLWKRLKNVAYNGHLAASELADAYGDKANAEDADIQAAEMNYLLKNAPLDDEARGTLTSLLNQRVEQVTDKMIAKSDQLVNLDKLDKFVESGDWHSILKKGPKKLADLDSAIAEVSQMMDSGYANYATDTLEKRLRDMTKYRNTLNQFIEYAPRQIGEESEKQRRKAEKEREEEIKRKNFGGKEKAPAPKAKKKK